MQVFSAHRTIFRKTALATLLLAAFSPAVYSAQAELGPEDIPGGTTNWGITINSNADGGAGDGEVFQINHAGRTVFITDGANVNINGNSTVNGSLGVTNDINAGGPVSAPTVNADTGNITTVNSTNITGVTVNGTTVNADTGNITTVNSTTGNIETVNSLTGNIATVNSTAIVNSGNASTDTLDVAGRANINTGSNAAAVTIGNAANTTNINSGTNNIGVNGFATANNIGTNAAAASTNVIGNTNTGTTVTSSAGANSAALSNTGMAIVGNTSVTGTLSSTGNTTLATDAATTNTFGSGTDSVNTMGNVGTSSNTMTGSVNAVTASTTNTLTAGTGNIVNAGTTNTLTAGTSNIVTATTGGNTINANAANQANSLNANGAGGSNLVSATGLNGINNILANAATGINNIEAKTNNVGVTTPNSINTIGNASTGTAVTSRAGASYNTLNNANATLGTGTGGMVQTNATTATVRASSTGALATNGSTGSMAVGAGGGYTAYATSQSTGTGTIGGIVNNKLYTNKLSGNTYIDGNVYINGTLDYVSSNSANTSVIGASSATSNLAGATTATKGGTAIVLKGATGTQAVVDANGKLASVTGTATESTAALTLTNGLDNTNGMVITETQASMSGGAANSSTLTMNDNGANFSNSATGAPVQVHGVNDGTSNFDAVNVRQFSSAIASVTAMANIPQVDQDKSYALGVGLGNFMGKTALALGGTYRFTRNGVLKGSISSAMNSSKSTTVGVGAAWSY